MWALISRCTHARVRHKLPPRGCASAATPKAIPPFHLVERWDLRGVVGARAGSGALGWRAVVRGGHCLPLREAQRVEGLGNARLRGVPCGAGCDTRARSVVQFSGTQAATSLAQFLEGVTQLRVRLKLPRARRDETGQNPSHRTVRSNAATRLLRRRPNPSHRTCARARPRAC